MTISGCYLMNKVISWIMKSIQTSLYFRNERVQMAKLLQSREESRLPLTHTQTHTRTPACTSARSPARTGLQMEGLYDKYGSARFVNINLHVQTLKSIQACINTTILAYGHINENPSTHLLCTHTEICNN